MKIIITGCAGRMGRTLVSNVMNTPGFELAGATERPGSEFLGLDAGNLAGCGPAGVKIMDGIDSFLDNADAIIDFSTGTVLENARKAAAHGLAIVIGTTALSAEVTEELHKLAEQGARIVQSYNYSVGVNLLFHLSAQAAKILNDGFDIEIVEAHHNQKKDAPSGTAVTLAKTVAAVRGLSYDTDVRHGRVGLVGARTKDEIGMHSLRGGDIVGDHTIMFAGNGERFELTHKASSRDTFAKGALRAAMYLASAKPGLYTMQDVLGLK